MPMEQVFGHSNRDSLKMAMLKHEETFRQQVHDLHRLYRIQKLLMRDLKREIKSQQRNLSTSPNGSAEHNNRPSALVMCSYEQWYGATRGGSHAPATPRLRTALGLDVAQAEEYAQSAGETDDEAELELTLAVGSGVGGGAKKRYGNEHCSPGESFSSSSTESDMLTGGGREWQQAHHELVGAGVGSPYRKRRPEGFDLVQMVEDSGLQQPSPLLFHWLSLRMA